MTLKQARMIANNLAHSAKQASQYTAKQINEAMLVLKNSKGKDKASDNAMGQAIRDNQSVYEQFSK